MSDVRRSVFCFLSVCVIVLCAVPCYGDSLLFIGVSGRRTNKEEAVRLALEDAARRLSFFHLVSAQSVKRDHRGSGAMDVRIESEYQLQYDDELEKFLETLEYNPATDIFENNNAVFVIARTASCVSMPSALGHSFGNRRPSWISSPPAEIDGFITGVGFSGRLSSHRDTIVRSYERAVVSIIENMETHVNGEQEYYQDTTSAFGFSLSSSGEISASGTIKNFYVIESWTDPDNLSVWTLAVASKSL